MAWKDIAVAEKSRINNSIPQEWRVSIAEDKNNFETLPSDSRILTASEIEITESSAENLVRELATGKLTSETVTTAFCKRAALAHQLTNCFHDFFPEAALARAKELDAYFEKHKAPVGPLHGLPISLKDQCRVIGRATHMGYTAWVGRTDNEMSVLTQLLWNAGAVFYVKTSVPQSLMVCETINNIIGRTTNPRNKNWSCGGSSGGEGALIGFRGSVIGVGTDIGGSIRVPAAFNNLYGLRPSHGRLPYAKMANSMQGQETIHSVCGPLAHSAADLRLFVTAVLNQKPWQFDSKVVPLPWRSEEEKIIQSKAAARQLHFGFYLCDNNVLPHPPILRGLQMVINKLKSAGYAVNAWEPFDHPFAVNLANKAYSSDGGIDVHKTLVESGEPPIPNFTDLLNLNLPKVTINELWELQLQKWDYQCKYLEAIRAFETKHGRELDAIIAPITPTAAVRHNQFKYYGYATTINVLDFTSVVVPVTFADKNIDTANRQFKPLNDMDALVQDDAEQYHGAPVAVQIIGRRLTEERVLAIAEEIGKLLIA